MVWHYHLEYVLEHSVIIDDSTKHCDSTYTLTYGKGESSIDLKLFFTAIFTQRERLTIVIVPEKLVHISAELAFLGNPFLGTENKVTVA